MIGYGRRVLLVADDISMRRIVTLWLELHDFRGANDEAKKSVTISPWRCQFGRRMSFFGSDFHRVSSHS